jgi:hypothetical protein
MGANRASYYRAERQSHRNGWFSDAMQVEHAICLMRKRIAHYSPVNSISSAKTGSVLIGLGVDRERFEEFFGPLGKIAFVAG